MSNGEAGQPLLLVLAERLLLRAGLEVPVLSEAVRLLEQEAATLSPTDRGSPAVLELLLVLGQTSRLEVQTQVASLLRPPQEYVRLALEEIHQQCLVWSLLTDYGTAPLSPEVAEWAADFEEPLSALALCFLRHQQLDAGGELLRVLAFREADHILVLVSGQVVEEGTHAELAERGGLYARLFLQ